MIGTVEGSLVGLSLGLTRVSPLESKNIEAELPDMLLGAPLGLCFGSEAVGYMCCCHRLMDFHESTCWGSKYFLCPSLYNFYYI